MLKNSDQDLLSLAFHAIAKATNLSVEEVSSRINSWNCGVQENNNKKLLTKKEVASWLHISLPTVDRYIKSGRLCKVALSKQAIRITEESVENFLADSNCALSIDSDTICVDDNDSEVEEQNFLF